MINKHTIIGRLGVDPELKTTVSGAEICTFTVATSERWRDKEGNMQEDTEWHKCVAWNKLATRLAEWWQKGTLVYIEGRSKTRKYQDGQGIDRYITEITVRNFKTLLGGKFEGAEFEEPKEHPGNDVRPARSMGEDVPF